MKTSQSNGRLHDPICIPIYVEEQKFERIKAVVLCPGMPDTACVVYEEHPPFFHDLRKAGLARAVMLAHDGMQPEPVVLTDETVLMKCRFGVPAACVAYRGESGEAVVVHGAGDDSVYRVRPRDGKMMEVLSFPDPSVVACSRDGQLLVVGNGAGKVGVFRIDEDESHLAKEVLLPSGVVALAVDEVTDRILVATDFHGVTSFSLDPDDDSVERHSMTLDGEPFGAFRALTLAASDKGLVAWAGVGNELWVSNPHTHQGEMTTYGGVDAIRQIQFVDGGNVMMIRADELVKIVRYELVEQNHPEFSRETITFKSTGGVFRLVGAEHYGSLLTMIHTSPAD
ncbi:MAG: lactonase family protein [Candidatus Obscuribacterales bacterium]|nr:lactonase family protein [Candidatus Obscuribacterales bacterium]